MTTYTPILLQISKALHRYWYWHGIRLIFLTFLHVKYCQNLHEFISLYVELKSPKTKKCKDSGKVLLSCLSRLLSHLSLLTNTSSLLHYRSMPASHSMCFHGCTLQRCTHLSCITSGAVRSSLLSGAWNTSYGACLPLPATI